MIATCVLLVADDPSVLRQAHVSLREAGYLVMATGEVDLALQMVRRVCYDLIVVDCSTFKRSDGAEKVSKKLSRLFHDARNVPIILGRNGPEGPPDMVDLTDSTSLARSAGEALDGRHGNMRAEASGPPRTPARPQVGNAARPSLSETPHDPPFSDAIVVEHQGKSTPHIGSS